MKIFILIFYLLITKKIVIFVSMTIATQYKVKRIIPTDEGFIILYDTDFAEGGTRDEAKFNMLCRVAVVNREIRRSKKMPVNEFKVLNQVINLN